MHWLWRIIAFVIDSIIAGIIASIIYYIILLPALVTTTVIEGVTVTSAAAWWAFYLLFPLIFGLIEVIYFVILDVAWSGTIGKRLLGLQVQTTKGSKVSIGQAIIRNISKIFWLFILLDWLIALVTAGQDRRQKLTDRWAGTTVIQARQPFQSVTPPPSSSPPPPPPPPQ